MICGLDVESGGCFVGGVEDEYGVFVGAERGDLGACGVFRDGGGENGVLSESGCSLGDLVVVLGDLVLSGVLDKKDCFFAFELDFFEELNSGFEFGTVRGSLAGLFEFVRPQEVVVLLGCTTSRCGALRAMLLFRRFVALLADAMATQGRDGDFLPLLVVSVASLAVATCGRGGTEHALHVADVAFRPHGGQKGFSKRIELCSQCSSLD